MTVKITNFGGVVQSIWVPDKRGRPRTSRWASRACRTTSTTSSRAHTGTPWPAAGGSGDTYFGAIIGRYANRIANASFPLNGTHLHARRQQRREHAAWWLPGLEHSGVVRGDVDRPRVASLELTNTFKAGEGC